MSHRLIFAFLVLVTFACAKEKKLDLTRSMDPAEVESRLGQYARVSLALDDSPLSQNQLTALRHMVQAAQAIDTLFWQQSHAEALAIRAALRQSTEPIDSRYLAYLEINYGPFDRQNDHRPFIGQQQKPSGAGFYPVDLTRADLDLFLQDNPSLQNAFLQSNTLIKRSGTELIAVRYEEAFEKTLTNAANHLRQAARASSDSLLNDYLHLRAEALLSGDFFASDLAWMGLQDNLLDIVIGPAESDEDRILGTKTAYQGLVVVRDLAASERLARMLKSMNELEARLPVPRRYKKAYVTTQAELGVFNTIYLSGSANAGPKSVALSIPKDARIRELKGTRTIQQKNIILAKHEVILKPIANKVLMPDLQEYISGDASFTHHLLHELAHPLGLTYIRGKNGVTVRMALKETYPIIAEAKAELLALYNVGYFVRRRVLPAGFEQKAYVTFVASLFRGVRSGAAEAHEKAKLIILNRLIKDSAIFPDPETRRYGINVQAMRNGIKQLATRLLMMMGDGDYAAASQLIDEMGFMAPQVEALIKTLRGIPMVLVFSFDPRVL